jgi:hypothetical protein
LGLDAQAKCTQAVPLLNDVNIGAEIRQLCAHDKPDAAVVDCMLLPALRAVQRSDIPHAVFTHTYRGYMNGHQPRRDQGSASN